MNKVNYCDNFFFTWPVLVDVCLALIDLLEAELLLEEGFLLLDLNRGDQVSSQSNDCLETIHLYKIEFVFYLFTSRAIRLALDGHGQAENNGNKEVHDDNCLRQTIKIKNFNNQNLLLHENLKELQKIMLLIMVWW
jgi:hypothetical protein